MDGFAKVNFSFFRYLAVFSGATVAIPVLMMLESTAIYLASSPLGGFFSNRFQLIGFNLPVLRPVFQLVFQFWFVLLLGAFGVAALVEGKRHYKKAKTYPTNMHLLAGSVAMGVIGTVVFLVFSLLISSLTPGGLQVKHFHLNFWEQYAIAASVILGSVICRISFGIGFKSERGSRTVSAGRQS